MEEVVSYSSAQHGIAEVFHAFVADVVIAHSLSRHRLMGEGHTIQSDVLRIKTKDIVDIVEKRFIGRVFGGSVKECHYHSNFLKITVAFCPPNPNELESP